jgi:hypothetical protein
MLPLTRFTLVVALGSAVGAIPAAGFVALGHGRLIGTVTARADYDSNIFVNSSEVDDYVGTVSGGVRYLRDASAVKFEAGAGVSLVGFADHSELNSADPYIDGLLAYSPSDKTEFQGSFSLRRSSIGNEALNDRTTSNDLALGGLFQHLTTEKLGLRLNAGYNRLNYMTPGYSDVLDYSVGVHGVHVYSPKLKLLAGITTREWWTENRAAGRRSPASQDWRYTLGAEGEVAAKVTGEVTAGLVQRDAETGFSDQSALYLSSRLSWVAAEKTTVVLAVTQDFSVSASDQSVKALNLSLSLTQAISEKMTLDGVVGLDRSTLQAFRDIGNRKDDGYSLRGRLGYAFADNVSFDVSGGYRHNDSNIPVASYDRFTFGVGASVKF